MLALFEKNSFETKKKYLKKLNNLVAYLKKHKTAIVEIRGHSDLMGDAKSCMEISEQRAEVVKKYLMEKGISAKRIFLKPMGRTFPIWYEETEDWQGKENRRAEAMIIE